MVTRYQFIEKILRQVYGGQPSQDSEISFNLANTWLSEAIAAAAKKNYVDAVSLDGIAYVNNSFYTTYKGLDIVSDRQFIYKIAMPDMPIGIGRNEGVASVKIQDGLNFSYDVVMLSANQLGYIDGMRPIPNKVLGWSEGAFFYVITSMQLYKYKALVRMISGGDSSNLDSILNVPSDYLPMMSDYLTNAFLKERQMPKDVVNDGVDN